MSAMRGSIPRRKGDPSRRPAPRPVVVKNPQSMYHNSGIVPVPVDGYATVYEYRFARAGTIESGTIQVDRIIAGDLHIEILQDNEKVYEEAISDTGKHEFPAVPVSPDHKYSIWIVQKGGIEEVPVAADIAFVFQEGPRG